MPRVHFVKKARKANPSAGIKVGDSYWWWKNRAKGARAGVKRVSKTRPRPSQLTMSEYFSQAYALQEQVEDMSLPSDADGLAEFADELRSVAEEVRTLGQDQQDKHDNMPDGLQQGETGQLLEGRANACESLADEIDSAADDLDSFELETGADTDDPEDQYSQAADDARGGLSFEWES